MTNAEIQAIFFVECEEALCAAETALDRCRAGEGDDETVNAIFRAVHSIKGGAGAFGFHALQAYAHGFETLLSDVRDGAVALDPPLIALSLRALDLLGDHVAAARQGTAAPDDEALLVQMAAAQAGADADVDLDAMLGAIAAELVVAGPPEDAGWIVTMRPRDGALANGGEPLLLLRELLGLGGGAARIDTAAMPPLADLDPGAAWLGWTVTLPGAVTRGAIEEIFDFVGADCALSIRRADEGAAHPAAAPPAAAAGCTADARDPARPTGPEGPDGLAGGPSIRIDLAKLDRLIDTVGELVIAQAMMAQRLAGEGLGDAAELSLLEGLTRDIQDSAMAIRAQPIGSIFRRVPRILRELEASTGKKVRLTTSGEATELDKTVIERLGDPLTHLIRNAVDHGIEPPEERIAAGKPGEGTLHLSAEHRSGRVVIRIADDGRGIDRQRVRDKAIERRLIAADAQLSDEEIDHLIFAPGFSTAPSLSTISGRGVGMDVVRQNVKELGGRIAIESQPGRGASFTLALPLTLAIADGMIVNVGDQTLVVPLAHVVESLRPAPGDVQHLGVGRMMLNVRGRFIPILPLGSVLGARGAVGDPTAAVLVVVDTESAGRAALLVDAIRDQRQFVIKSLDTHYRAIDGVAGATILGNGRVALIVDVDALVASTVSTAGALREAA